MSKFPPVPIGINEMVGQRLGSEFEPLSIYDAPGVVLGNVLDGDLSWQMVHDAFLGPDRLAPSQRETLADKISGGDGFTKTLLSVATNPWVWLGFLTSPVGSKAIRSGGSLFMKSKAYSGYSKKAMGWFSHMLSPLEVFSEHGTNALDVSNDLRQMSEVARSQIHKAEEGLLGAFNRKLGKQGRWSAQSPLSSSSYAKGSEEYKVVRDWEVLQGLVKHRLHEAGRQQNIQEVYGKVMVKRAGETDWRELNLGEMGVSPSFGVQKAAYVELQKTAKRQKSEAYELWKTLPPAEKKAYLNRPEAAGDMKAAQDLFVNERVDLSRMEFSKGLKTKASPTHWVGEDVEKWLGEYGTEGREYLKSLDRMEKHAVVDFIGDMKFFEETGGFRVDREKLVRASSSFQRELDRGTGEFGAIQDGVTTLQGKEAIMAMLGTSRFSYLKNLEDNAERVKYLEEAIKDVVQGGVEEGWDGMWASRNAYAPTKVMIAGKKKAPLQSLSDIEKANLYEAPWSVSTSLSNKVAPITEKEILFNPEDMEYVMGKGIRATQEGLDHYRMVRSAAQKAYDTDGAILMTMRLAGDESTRTYMRNIHQATAFDTRAATLGALKEDSEGISKLVDDVKNKSTYIGMGVAQGVADDLMKLPEEHQRLISRGDLMNRFYVRNSAAPGRQKRIRDVLIPGALNNAGPEYVSVYDAHLRTKELANTFANSFIGRTIEKWGDEGKAFIEKVRSVGDFDEPRRFSSLSDGLAKWFYTTHLGLNMSSAIMNMTQPLLLAAAVGSPMQVLRAYKKSFMEMAGYAKERASIGKTFLNADEKLALMKKHFKYMDFEGKNLMGIGPDAHQIFDSHLARSGVQQGSKMARVSEFMMKGFEKTEWFNRNTAAHILEEVYKGAGRATSDPHFVTDLQRFVLQTQFGQNDLNTPLIFQRGVLANPLIRQFMTFPIRSFTNVVSVFPTLGGENYLKGLFNTTVRGMAASAILYEASKGLLGADMSRGLFASSSTQLLGGDKLLDERGQIVPLPPVVNVPVGFIRGFVNSDMEALVDATSRLIPGGVAMRRALGVAPEMPRFGVSGFPGNLQNQFVGWDQPQEDGTVPVFRGDGNLIGFKKPQELVLKAFGVDLNAWAQQGELDGYLVKQRAQVVKARHEFLRALAGNDVGRAMAIKRSFEDKYKVPLTVKQAQVKDYFNNRSQTRTERLLEGLPADVKGQFGQMAGVREERPPIDPELVQEVMARMAQVGPAATQSTNFTPFSGYR